MSIENRRGFILITAFLAIVMLLILSGAFFMSSLTEQRVSQRQLANATTFYLAEAGIDDAIVRLRTDDTYPGTTPATTSLGIQGEFETRVTQPDPINQPTVRRIESWGYTPRKDSSAYGYQMKKLEAYVNVTPSPLFPMALFTQEEIELNNSLIDSYDSSRGPYGGSNIGNNGDIGSNNLSGEDDVIELKGSATVKGDATVGPSVPWGEAIDVDSGSQITGTQSNATKVTALPSPEVPGGTTPINLSNVNDAQTFPGGVYSASSIKIAGGGSVQFSGPTTLYVTGDVDIGGNGMLTSGSLPANLIIKVVGEQDVKISGNANFYGGMYAPKSEVEIKGNGNVFGAVAAKEAEVGVAGPMMVGIHYDETMIRVLGGAGFTVTLLGWHESQ